MLLNILDKVESLPPLPQTVNEIEIFRNTEVSPANEKLMFYKLIYNKIERTSLDINNNKIPFEKFLNITSPFDISQIYKLFPSKLKPPPGCLILI